MNPESETKTLSLTFDNNVYSLNAVKSAAFRFLRSFTSDISIMNGQIHCALTFAPPVAEQAAQRLALEFKKEILDQDLREKLKAETEAVRNLILAHAFSKTGLINNEPLSGN